MKKYVVFPCHKKYGEQSNNTKNDRNKRRMVAIIAIVIAYLYSVHLYMQVNDVCYTFY